MEQTFNKRPNIHSIEIMNLNVYDVKDESHALVHVRSAMIEQPEHSLILGHTRKLLQQLSSGHALEPEAPDPRQWIFSKEDLMVVHFHMASALASAGPRAALTQQRSTAASDGASVFPAGGGEGSAAAVEASGAIFRYDWGIGGAVAILESRGVLAALRPDLHRLVGLVRHAAGGVAECRAASLHQPRAGRPVPQEDIHGLRGFEEDDPGQKRRQRFKLCHDSGKFSRFY